MAPAVDRVLSDPALPEATSVVVIGGGIIGVCTAFFLARKGVPVVLCEKGEIAGDPDVVIAGIPQRLRDGRTMDAIVDKVVFEVLDTLPRARRRDANAVETAVERAVRSAVRNVWGKRPTVHVLVMEV